MDIKEPKGAYNRAPIIDGENYDYWKECMSVHIQSVDMDVWDAIANGRFCHTLILDLKILAQTSFCFWSFQSLRLFYNFYCARNVHFTVIISNLLAFKAIQSVFLHYKSSKRVPKTISHFSAFYSNFVHKIIQKGILVISYKGTHFSPHNLSLSLFNLSA